MTNFFHWISRDCQIKNIKYIHQNIIYYVTLKNLILKYIGMTNINILKRKCHVGINVVFLEVILKLYECFMKNIFIAPWTCLHHFDLHIIIRWPENVKRVNKICIHCYILLNSVLFFLAVHEVCEYWWHSYSLQNMKINYKYKSYKTDRHEINIVESDVKYHKP